jgi:hypothetical protein
MRKGVTGGGSRSYLLWGALANLEGFDLELKLLYPRYEFRGDIIDRLGFVGRRGRLLRGATIYHS